MYKLFRSTLHIRGPIELPIRPGALTTSGAAWPWLFRHIFFFEAGGPLNMDVALQPLRFSCPLFEFRERITMRTT